MPADWRHGPEGRDSLCDLGWCELFKDPALHELISTAVVANRDLQVAVARVLESRAPARGRTRRPVPAGQCRRRLLTIPEVTVLSKPNGEPMAITHSPGLTLDDCPSLTVGSSSASISTTATSDSVSCPSTLALNWATVGERHDDGIGMIAQMTATQNAAVRTHEARSLGGDDDVVAGRVIIGSPRLDRGDVDDSRAIGGHHIPVPARSDLRALHPDGRASESPKLEAARYSTSTSPCTAPRERWCGCPSPFSSTLRSR